MKLQRKTLFILGVTFITLFLIQHVASQMIFLDSFANLEEQDARQNVERAHSALLAELSNLDSYVYDWAAWDDTYVFIQDINDEYIESNLVDETFICSELNFMVFVDSSAEIVYSKALDLETEEEIPLPQSIKQHLTSNSVLLQHEDVGSYVNGLLLLPEGPVLIVSRPIIQSDDEGPILGSLLMGYYFDFARLDSLSETTHLSLDMQLANDLQMPDDYQKAKASLSDETPIFVTPTNSTTVAGYTILEDIYGEPCLILKVDLPRSIFTQGQLSLSYFFILLLSTGATFSVVTLLLLEKTVLSRLAQLSKKVNKIQHNGDPSQRVSASGNDEISDLADEINKMLTSLEQSQTNLRMLNKKLSVVGSLTRHDARNKLSIITSNAYLAKQKLSDNPDALEFLATIDSTVDTLEKIFEFARIYEKLGVEALSYVDVKKSVDEAAMLIGLEGIELVNECSGLTVLSDSLLRQIFYNLIDNTLWHGKMVTLIKVYYTEEKDRLELVYEDNGVGIPENEKELIFKEGYGKITGYGLYLISNICEAYGWTIKETGTPGKGAQFTMIIPKKEKDGKENYRIG